MSFLNPIFLIALATALLPILYHLVRRVQAKKVQFSSLMFLKMTPREVVRRRHLQHWLLMAIRCILLALLALAFARPFIPKENIPFLSQREDRSVVLVIDNSYSMGFGDLFEQAKAEARRKLSEAAGDDEYAIILFSNETQQLTPLTTDIALHQNVIDNVIAPSYRSTDFYQPLRLAEDILSEAANSSKHVVLISDLQLIGWKGAFENWKLNESISFEVVNLAADTRSNAYVQDFSVSEKRSEGQVVNRFDARVGVEGSANLESARLELEIGGDKIGDASLPASSLRKSSFQYSAPRQGFFQGSVYLPADELSADNTRYFTYSVEGRPALLGVGGSRRDPGHAVYYLDRAFNQGEASLYDFRESRQTGISRGALREIDAVFISNGNPPEREITALKQFVENGGSAIISFSSQADMPAFSRMLQAFGVGRVDQVVRARSVQGYDAIIGEVDMRHPIFSIFATSGSGSIFRPKFRQYARIQPDSSASVLGRFDSEDPFLIESNLGRGKVLVFTSSLSPEWTDFSISEMYIPFLYQLTKYVLQTRTDQRMYDVGEPVRFEGPEASVWDVRAPDDNIYKVEMGDDLQGYFEQTELPGHYIAANGGEQRFFSVNVDVEESALESRDMEEAYGAVVPPPDEVPVSVEEARAVVLDDEERQQKFWRYVILSMILFYLAETVIANRKQKKL